MKSVCPLYRGRVREWGNPKLEADYAVIAALIRQYDTAPPAAYPAIAREKRA